MVSKERVGTWISFAVCLGMLSGCSTWRSMWGEESSTSRSTGSTYSETTGSYGTGSGAGGTTQMPAQSYSAERSSAPSTAARTETKAVSTKRTEPHARMKLEGLPPVSPAAAGAINALLGGTVEAALRGDTASVASRLLPDEQRKVAHISGGALSEMQRVAHEFDMNWNSKYGSAFSWNPSMNQEAFGSYQISKGSNDKIAEVITQPAYGMKRERILLRDEGNNTWRINAPEALVSGTKLKDRIYAVLTDLNRSKNNWPASSAEASRYVSEKVLAIFARS